MDFDITKVTIDGDVGDLSEDQLRELVSKFQDAQESNVAEFEKAIEQTPDLEEGTVEDFQAARESLIEEITEAEAFDEVPLTEEKLDDEDFSELQDWKAFVADKVADDETGETDDVEGSDFDDFGTKSPTPDDDEMEDFVEDELGSMPGLNL